MNKDVMLAISRNIRSVILCAAAYLFLDSGQLLIAQEISWSEGQARVGHAEKACRQAQYQSAEDNYKQAINIFQKLRTVQDASPNLTLYEGHALVSKGDCYLIYRGLLDEALDAYQQAQTLFERTPSAANDSLAGVLGRIGNTYSELSEYLKAAEAYRKGLNYLHKSNNLTLKGQILRDIGTTYMKLGLYKDALHASQQARDIFITLKDRKNIVSVLTTFGAIYEVLGENDWSYFFRSRHFYQEALNILLDIDDPKKKGIVLNNIGKTLQRLGDETNKTTYYTDALHYYRQARKQYQIARKRKLEANTWNNIGGTHLALSTHEHQTEHLREALSALTAARNIQETTLQDESRLWITYSNFGRLYEAQGQPEKAFDYYQKAINLFEKLIESSPVEDFTISLREQLDASYQQAIMLLWDAKRYEEAFFFSERARARAFLDQFGFRRAGYSLNLDQELLKKKKGKLTELDRDYRQEISRPISEQNAELLTQLQGEKEKEQEEYAAIRRRNEIENLHAAGHFSMRPLQLDPIRQNLDDDTTLLSFFVTPGKTLAFIITKSTFKTVKLSIKEWELYENIRKTRRHPLDRATDPPKELETLYAQLIAPLKKYLQTPVIGIIPHNILHSLPFAALTPDRRSYFGEEHILYVLPSAGVLTLLPKRPIPENAALLALAYGEVEGLPPLIFVDDEIEAISRKYKTLTLKGKDATASSFEQLAACYSILHLAAHGELNLNNPRFSRIILADGALNVDGISRLHLTHTALVVLSACNTNLGKRSRGDDIVGLTRAFMVAGAPSIVSSLWPVNDKATAEFMTHFYTQLKRKKRPAEALQVAQKNIRKTYPHPYYWAGFVLTGLP